MPENFLTITQTSQLLESGKASSHELTTQYLHRIKKIDPQLNAYVTVTAEHALAQAKKSDERRKAGKSRGTLDGIPGALKDVITTKDIPSTASSHMLEHFKPPYNAFVTDLLSDAGAVMVGKTNLDEFAMGTTTEYSAFGVVKNPWDQKRVAGGSSGGSVAAVAADEAMFALGTDTGGSIRLPAAWCGAVGLKPTYGRVSRNGVIAMASSLDQVGTITRSVEDAATVLQAIAVHDKGDSTSVRHEAPNYVASLHKSIKGMRLGVVKEFFGEGIDVHVATAVHQAIDHLTTLGADVVEVSLPLVEVALAVYCIMTPAEVTTNLERYDGIKYGYSSMTLDKAQSLLQVYLESRSVGFGAEAKRRIMLGSYVLSSGYYDQYYAKALKVRTLIKQQFDAAFTAFDCLLGPTCPTQAFRIGENDNNPLATWMADVLAVPVNIAGLPAMSVPCGLHDGLPIGLQIIANQFREEDMLAVASAFEASTKWHTNHPSISQSTNSNRAEQ